MHIARFRICGVMVAFLIRIDRVNPGMVISAVNISFYMQGRK